METRYIRINSCKECPYTGHASNVYNKVVTFFCINPLHSKIDEHKSREKIGKEYYPITNVTEDYNDNPIPEWCELPSKVADKRC